ncbi:hypothetical protein ACI3LY_004454 [Candidozyma auris]|uniref:Uncharacterized protein n=1 Tax=Candidozyma auris TaxID=498019 RepID=A0A2H0ZCZ8_CANAR|nr:hypothetical_protein [[Candida] auris]KNE01563.2 hypothetical protein QG37_01394 [[Candida] auris]PIS48495.1 hypothetical protein B9J08_005189 [[Candida] auris]PIS49108.1 hypothetical protein CJI97_005273 [[Candida] auris]PSK79902.1 hypothetical protein CJJ07_000265 [[Candida] auris]QEL61999.1 hypothetical protein CJJ09_004163 [[Candida] auris]
MSDSHSNLFYILTAVLIVAGVFLKVLKTLIIGFCVALLQIRRIIDISVTFVGNVAKLNFDLMFVMASFALSVIESIQGREVNEKLNPDNKYANMVSDASNQILENTEVPEVRSEQDATSITSKHRFSSALHGYFSKKEKQDYNGNT